MKTIVCYGDSNTWGYDPETKLRHEYPDRYPGALQRLLGPEYLVFEEGMNGRTTAFDDPIEPFRNGLSGFDYCMLTNMPVDLLIIALGVNDLKRHQGLNAFVISKGLECLVKRAKNPEYGRNNVPPQILIVSPIEVCENIEETWVKGYIDNRGRAVGLELSSYYKEVADLYGCYFLDASKYAKPSEIDAIHMTAEEQKKLADALYNKIKEIGF